MIWFGLSTLFSSAIYLIFRKVGRVESDLVPMVAVNYLTCSLLGVLMVSGFNQWESFNSTLGTYALLLGSLFISFFSLMGKTTQRFGVAVSSLVSRVSLVVPFTVFIFVEGGNFSFQKLIGIALALTAITLSIGKPAAGKSSKSWWLPLSVFLGYGIIDVLLKMAESSANGEPVAHLLSFLIFSMAAVYGVSWTLIGRRPIKKEHITWGIALGVVNYASIFLLFLGIRHSGLDASVLFPINGILILVLSTLGSVLLMKETLKMRQAIGLGLAIVAILLLYFNFHE